MFYAGVDLPAQRWILYRGYGNAVVSVSTPNIFTWQALVMSVLLYGAETWTFLVADMNTLEAIHMRFQRQVLSVRWWLISPMQKCFSYLVCQPLVTSYVVDAFLCLAMLHAWTLECQNMPTFYCYLCLGDLRSPGVMKRRNSPHGLCDDDDDDNDDDDEGWKTYVKNGG